MSLSGSRNSRRIFPEQVIGVIFSGPSDATDEAADVKQHVDEDLNAAL